MLSTVSLADEFELSESDKTLVFLPQVKMEVAVPEEPQKKIFRARKTMKMSDRQQLEALHSTLATASSASYPSSTSPPLVNGTHEKEKEKVKDNDLKHKETDLVSPAPDSPDSSPSPSLSVSISPASPDVQSTSPSSVKNGPEKKRNEKTKDAKGENESKEEVKVNSKDVSLRRT